MNHEQIKATRQYVIEWLKQAGFAGEKWDRVSEDGHWLIYSLTTADGSKCPCCWEVQYERVKEVLRLACGWQPLNFEALNWIENTGKEGR